MEFLPGFVLLVASLLLLVVLIRRLRVDAVPREPAERRRVIRSAWRDAALVAGIGGALIAFLLYVPASRAPLLETDSKDLELTSVVPCPEVPLLATRNHLWCASFPLAWDALRRDLLAGAPLTLGPPACKEEMAALNGNPFPAGDLDPSCVVAMAGTQASGIGKRIRDALAGRAAVELPALGPADALAFGWLDKDLPFAVPFETIEGGLPFGEDKTPVRAFGLAHHSKNPRMDEILEQVRIHLAESDQGAGAARLLPTRFIVELVPQGGRDRILLARIPARATLEETWQAVAKATAGPGMPAQESTVLAVPKLNFDIDHRFTQFEGAPFTGGVLRQARQRTRFRLDETGARLRSIVPITLTLGIDPTFEFKGPFLLALIQKGATRPYLLLWVGNAELLAAE